MCNNIVNCLKTIFFHESSIHSCSILPREWWVLRKISLQHKLEQKTLLVNKIFSETEAKILLN